MGGRLDFIQAQRQQMRVAARLPIGVEGRHRYGFQHCAQQWADLDHPHLCRQLIGQCRAQIHRAIVHGFVHHRAMRHAARDPRCSRRRQQAQLVVQGDTGAALAREQQLPALVAVQAGVVITEQGGNADDRRCQVVGIESSVVGEPGHRLSDLMGKLSKSG